jgi:pSer/pThr/pTyr-binding forkhead associated (FHA) protein
VADLGSTNGTLVNESSVAERELQDGDRITIGRTVLEFRRR